MTPTLPDDLRARAQLYREASRECAGARRDSLLCDAQVLDLCAKRIEQLERRLEIWRDDYARSADGALVTIPVHQITTLIGEKPA